MNREDAIIEFYFQMRLTENEHSIYEDYLRKYLTSEGVEVMYYRKLKTGHVPCQREIKIKGPRRKVRPFVRGWKKNVDFFIVY